MVEDGARLGNLLDVDDQLGIDDVRAHLDEQVGTARQHARVARGSRQQGNRSVQRLRGFISHVWSSHLPWVKSVRASRIYDGSAPCQLDGGRARNRKATGAAE